ncbi:hypothetical protein C453_01095 [Haloferax elongans ATCC BAA-1513]|uniref:Uncharacterized protein n=1 Tax=Haloferax elongans ATCC BAA-1513 TaxID=1230453 RepID=M0HWB9_HALEO|nr:hypothetical protein [Haloferax elongans]ELZ88816.1 hypothetical protein C453_01095 [Haloferax elongans ATCC BAA-1513]
MQRRTLLGLVGSIGVAGVLGAKAGIDGKPSIPAATYAEEPVPSTGQRTSPIVATDTTTAGSKTYGTVRQSASIHDLESTGRYALVTKYQLIPGSNYNARSGWKTASLTVEHGWTSGSLVSHSGDIVPADNGNADSNLYLGTTDLTRQYRWHLMFDGATGNSHTFRFATVVDREEVPERGDALVDLRFGAGFTKGFLGASERDLVTARLIMQGTNK